MNTKTSEASTILSKFIRHFHINWQKIILCLAALIGALLAIGFIYFLATRFDIFNPTTYQRFLMLIISAFCAGISFVSFHKLALLKRGDK